LGGFVIVPEVGLEGFFLQLFQAGLLGLDVKDDLEGFGLFAPTGRFYLLRRSTR
jgi:hypothetical protein